MHNNPARAGLRAMQGRHHCGLRQYQRGERSMTWTWTASVSVLPATGTDLAPCTSVTPWRSITKIEFEAGVRRRYLAAHGHCIR